jgi:hypothetical protein
MHITQSIDCSNYYSSTFIDEKEKENNRIMDHPRQHRLLALRTVNSSNDNEPGISDVNTEGEDESMSTVEDAAANESLPQVDLDPNVCLSNEIIERLGYSNDRRVEVSLLKMLNDVGAPLYAFSSVIGWAEDAFKSGYRFNPCRKHFATYMKDLQEWTKLGDLRPKQKMVTLAKDGFQVPVVCFDFSTAVISLFNDPRVNQLENLIINPDDPFGKYISPDGKLNDVNSAQIYELAYNHCCTTDKDFLALVILYMDKTVISQTKEGLSALPVMMTVATFNCEVNTFCLLILIIPPAPPS